MANLSDKTLGKYKLQKLLGEGGMGAVYKSRHPNLDRDVAIKTIHGHLMRDSKAIDRFQHEAKIVAGLRHPSIVQVYDFDVQDETFYMVMEFVPGQSLESYLLDIHEKGQRLTLEQALRLFIGITKAVAYAHEQGIAHQDLKPANVLMTKEGTPVLADFGLSRIVGVDRKDSPGTVSGTPQYMSPEQCSGESGDTRSDVYSLGVMLYELVTGTLPFSSKTAVGLILKHMSEAPPSPRSINVDLPASIEEIIYKCMEKSPDDRYPSAQELMEAVQDIVATVTGVEIGEDDIPLDGRCPYRGLEAFQEEHAEFYFGREVLVDHLVNKVKQMVNPASEQVDRFLTVLGASGSGKSSLVRAGLIPKLRQGAAHGSESWTILTMKPGSRPLEELTNQLTTILGGAARAGTKEKMINHLAIDGRTLHMVTRALWAESPPHERLLLIVDQFEEVFTLCPVEAERRSFIENLLYAAAVSDGRVVVMLTMRADFYHRCAVYQDLADRISSQQMLVGPMSEAELRRAIEQPALHVGLRFEPGLVDTIMNDVAQQPGALPLLQHALLELWEGRYGRLLLLRIYQASGGVAGAISQRADTLFNSFDPHEQNIVRRIMMRLTQPGEGTEDTRRRASKRELVAGDASQAIVVDSVVQRLADARLVTTTVDPATDEVQVDVAHEALIRGWTRLREWLDEDREALRTHRRLTEASTEWERNNRDASYLYRGARLAEAEEWIGARGEELNQQERDFVENSIALRDKELQEAEAQRRRELEQAQALAEAERERAETQAKSVSRLRRFAIALAVIFLIAVGAAIFAFFQQRRAVANEVLAQEQAQAALEAQQVAETQRAAAETARNEAEVAREDAVSAQQVAETRRQEAEAAQAQAEKSARDALSGQLAAHAQASALENFPQRSLLVAVEAMQVNLQAGEPADPAAQDTLRQGLANTSGQPLLGQDDLLTATSISPDNQWLAEAGGATIRLWNVAALSNADGPAAPLLLPGHQANVTQLGMSSRWLVSGDENGLVQLWNIGPDAASIPLPGHRASITAIAFSPDDRWLATGSADNSIRLWDISAPDSGVTAIVLAAHQAPITAIAISPDGRWLVSGDSNGGAFLWDLTTVQNVDNLRPVSADLPSLFGETDIKLFENAGASPVALGGHTNTITAIEFGPNSNFVVTGSDDGTARMWPFAGASTPPTPIILPVDSFVTEIAISPDNQWLAVAAWDNAVHLWPLGPLSATNTSDYVVLSGHTQPVLDVAISSDSHWLVSAGNDRTARRWDLTAADPSNSAVTLRGHEAEVIALSIDSENRLITGSSDGTARLWPLDTATGSTAPTVLQGNPEAPFNAAITIKTGQAAWVAVGESNGDIRLWDTAIVDNAIDQSMILSGHASPVTTLATDNAQWLASGDLEGGLLLWDISALVDSEGTAQIEPVALPGHQANITALIFSPDHRWLASGSDDGMLLLWDLQNDNPQPIYLTGHEGSISALAVDPNGRWLASGSGDTTIRLWDTAALLDGANPDSASILLRNHEAPITDMTISDDGRWLVTGSDDTTARLWAVEPLFTGSAKTVAAPIILSGHEDRILSVAISPNSQWLATTAADNTVRLWQPEQIAASASAGEAVTTETILRGQERPIFAVDFSPNGELLATAGGDRVVRVWNLTKISEKVGPVLLRGHERPIFMVAFNTDSALVSASNDNTVRLWSLQADELIDLACSVTGRNLTQAEWTQFFGEQPYRKTCPNLPAHRSVVGVTLGNIQAAVAEGDLQTAAADYSQITGWALELQDAQLDNQICWQGSLDGFAETALPACNQAIDLAPNDGSLRDSRGLARALSGDFTGAAEDFTEFVAWSKEVGLYELYGQQREGWVAQLEANQNPFDETMLESLRGQ